MRTREIANARTRRDVLASGVVRLHLRPPVGGSSTTDFSAGRDIMRVGYDYARSRLDDKTVADLTG